MAQTQPNFDAQIAAVRPSLRLDFNDSSTTFRDRITGAAFVPSLTGTILPKQPGFDATWPANTSASFSFDSYTVASDGTIGSFEWNQPFSIHYVVDGLTTAPAVLLSKGDSDPYNGIGYRLEWGGSGWWAGSGSLCFRVNIQSSAGNTAFSDCVLPGQIPVGYNLDIWATYAGTGNPSDLHLYVNGTDFYQGSLNLDPQNPLPGRASTMMTSEPLHIPGDVNGWGTSGAPLRVDEVDIVPGVVTQEAIQGTFLHTKFYQALLSPKPSVPPKLILSEDGCADMDNIYAIELALAAHKLGYLRVSAIAASVDDGGFYRALLDNAGLNHIPLVRPNPHPGANGNVCNAATTTPAYNASIDMKYDDLPDAATMYRRIIAGLAPGEKVVMMYGGPYTDLAQFLQSDGDSISPLTGLQMLANSVQEINFQSGMPPTGTVQNPIPSYDGNGEQDSATANYVVSHNGLVPLNWYEGTPQGPSGSLHTRSHTDPLWLTEHISGTDSRTCWDCLPIAGLLTSAFRGVPAEGQMIYGDPNVGAGEYASSSSNQWLYPLSDLAANSNVIFAWFLSSMIGPIPTGRPGGN